MPLKSAKLKTSGSSSRNDTVPIPKARPPSHRKPLSHPHYLVVDTTLPSHIFSDRSLFTTYTPSHKSHQTVFGSNIIIEGIGDVHVRVFVSGKSILFRFRDSWHVPSSPRHFFSCSATISLGNHFMIASCSPRMIFSHKCRLAEPNLPKYVPFVRVDGLMVLPFDIPAQGSFSLEPESTSTATRSTTQTSLSLPASAVLPFAGLSFNRNFSTSQQVSFPLADGDVATHPSASEMLNTSTGVVLHGGAHALVDMDPSILNDDMNFASHGDALAADQMLMPVVGTVGHIMNVNGDPEDQIANTYGDVDAQVALNVNEDGVVSDALYGGAVHADARSQPNATSSLNSSSRDFDFPIPILSLDSVTLDPESEAQGSFTLRVPTRYHHYYPPYTLLPLTSIPNINTTIFLLSFNNSSFHSFSPLSTLFESSFFAPVQQSHIPFSPQLSGFSIIFHPCLQLHDSPTVFPSSLHFDSSLLSIIFSLRVNFFRPTRASSCFNLISSATSAISLRASTSKYCYITSESGGCSFSSSLFLLRFKSSPAFHSTCQCHWQCWMSTRSVPMVAGTSITDPESDIIPLAHSHPVIWDLNWSLRNRDCIVATSGCEDSNGMAMLRVSHLTHRPG